MVHWWASVHPESWHSLKCQQYMQNGERSICNDQDLLYLNIIRRWNGTQTGYKSKYPCCCCTYTQSYSQIVQFQRQNKLTFISRLGYSHLTYDNKKIGVCCNCLHRQPGIWATSVAEFNLYVWTSPTRVPRKGRGPHSLPELHPWKKVLAKSFQTYFS